MSAIKVENLSYSYPGLEPDQTVRVFEDLDLEIEQGTFVAILGSNGSGKSTLAKHFNAILLPGGGKCHVYGMDTGDEELLIPIRRSVGMVFQNPDNQIVANVVEEDVAFAPENLGVASPMIRHRVDNALKQVGMYHYRTHSPNLLSGGQKQRIAIAGVIAMEPRCIVLDEPTAMLDPKGRRGATTPKPSRSTASGPCNDTQVPMAKGRMKPEVIGPEATPPESKAMAVYTGGTNRLRARDRK